MINLSDLTNLIVNIVRRELLKAKFGAGGGPVFPPSVEIGGTAGGDLTGTYPDPVVAKIRSVLVSAAAMTPADGDILKYSASDYYWYPTPESAGGSVTGSGTAGQMTKWTDASAIGNATNTDTEVALAVIQANDSTSRARFWFGA